MHYTGYVKYIQVVSTHCINLELFFNLEVETCKIMIFIGNVAHIINLNLAITILIILQGVLAW